MSLNANQLDRMPLKQVEHPIRALENTLRLLWLNRSGINDSDNGAEFRPYEYPGILDTDLTALTSEERLVFKVHVCVLCVLSLCGNISTLGVNFRRKMRPFFRACLISLALSDLLNTVFLTTVYYAQFSTEYVQIWVLGGCMCKLVPFITTSAILASSMTLVVIALDRYFAVMKAYVSHWKPGLFAGVICMLAIWIISLGISGPVFWIYHIISVYILTVEHVESEEPSKETNWQAEASKENLSYTLVKVEELVLMCVSDQKDVALYYIIVFSIIFAPSIIAFVWLNATIAKKIWIRRHRPQNPEKTPKATSMRSLKLKNARPTSTEINSNVNTKSTKLSTATSGNTGNRRIKSNYANGTREARHFRMVVVIILLIAVFICLRLPAWIFLLMRMYGSYTKPHDWIIYFAFGMMNMASCALNPLFYTFLHETIQYILCCKMKCGVRRRKAQRCIGRCNCNCAPMSTDASCKMGCCACCGFFCGIFGMCPRLKETGNEALHEQRCSGQDNSKPGPLSLEKDEGVDCSDASSFDDDDTDTDGNENEFQPNEESVSCNQQVFTVFSLSLVQVPVELALKE